MGYSSDRFFIFFSSVLRTTVFTWHQFSFLALSSSMPSRRMCFIGGHWCLGAGSYGLKRKGIFCPRPRDVVFSFLFPWIHTFRSSMAHRVEIRVFLLSGICEELGLDCTRRRTYVRFVIYIFILYYTDDWVCVAGDTEYQSIIIVFQYYLIAPRFAGEIRN